MTSDEYMTLTWKGGVPTLYIHDDAHTRLSLPDANTIAARNDQGDDIDFQITWVELLIGHRLNVEKLRETAAAMRRSLLLAADDLRTAGKTKEADEAATAAKAVDAEGRLAQDPA